MNPMHCILRLLNTKAPPVWSVLNIRLAVIRPYLLPVPVPMHRLVPAIRLSLRSACGAKENRPTAHPRYTLTLVQNEPELASPLAVFP